MKTTRRCLFVLVLLLLSILLLAGSARAQVPNLLNYQGRISVGTANFTGTGQFRFALTNSTGTTYYWTSDGSVVSAPQQPANAVSIPVTNGQYSVLLGDTSLANMTAIPTSVWANPDVRLRVFFSDGVNTSQALSPDQRLAPTGYLASGLTLAGTSTLTGDLNLPATTSASTGVLQIGGSPFLHAYGANGLSSENTFAGSNAGNFTLSGTLNTGTGYQALSADTTGSGNTASGTTALKSNTAGNGNTAAGYQALFSNTGGSNNSALGNVALYGNTTAGENVALGTGALQLQSFANGGTAWNSLNVAVGYNALLSNQPTATTNGVNNVALGANALSGNTTGANNIGLGNNAGLNLTTGSNNIDIGSAGVAGETGIIRIGDGATQTATYLTGTIYANSLNLPAPTSTAGVLDIGGAPFLHAYGRNGLSDGNTFVGDSAGNFTLTGTENTAEGYKALRANTQGNDNSASGFQALYSNTLGNDNSASGSGALYSNTQGNYNTASGYGALFASTGSGNIAVGAQAGYNLTTGSNNIDIGSQGVAGESNVIRLGDGSTQTDTYLTGLIHGSGLVSTTSADKDTLGTTSVELSLGLRLMNSSTSGSTSSPNVTGIAFGQSSTRQAIVGETYGNDGLDFYVSGNLTTPRVRIDANGRLGVNTINPAYPLDVAGSARVSTAIYDDGILSVTGNTTLSGNLTLNGSLTLNTGVGFLNLAATTSATAGVLGIGGTPFLHAYGQSGLSSENTFVGSGAGDFTMLGSNNTGVGYHSLTSVGNGTDNTAVGVTSLGANQNGFANTAVGSGALANTNAGFNTAVGYQALLTNTTGTVNTAIGYQANVSLANLTNATAIGYGALVSTSNAIQLGNSNITSLRCQVALTVTSDRRQKENFAPVDGAEVLRKLRAMDVPSWNFIGQDPSTLRHYGPMAQDFFAAFGHDAVGASGDDTTINSGDLAGITLLGVKELSVEQVAARAHAGEQDREITALRERNKAADDENAALKKRLADLERQDREREARLAKLERLVLNAPEDGTRTVSFHAGE